MRTRIQAGIIPALLAFALMATAEPGTHADEQDTAAAQGTNCTGACDLLTLWRSVDTVIFLRIQKTPGTRVRNLDGQESLWVEHRALVHEVFRRFQSISQPSLDFLQARDDTSLIGTADSALGEEFVAFLRWSNEEQMFESYFMLPVRDGQVQSPRVKELESSMKLETLLKTLRTMME